MLAIKTHPEKREKVCLHPLFLCGVCVGTAFAGDGDSWGSVPTSADVCLQGLLLPLARGSVEAHTKNLLHV